jgi:hypothetical protein
MDAKTEIKIAMLRVAIISFLKYHPEYGLGENVCKQQWWRIVKNEQKLPTSITSVAGDAFGWWYGELRMNPAEYWIIAAMFFEKIPAYLDS